MAFITSFYLLQKQQRVSTPIKGRKRLTTVSHDLRRRRSCFQHTTMQIDTPESDNSIPHPSIDSDPQDTIPSDEEPVYETSVAEIPLSDLKSDLYAAVSSLNRGLAASPAARRQVVELVEQLERQNPTANPSDSPKLLAGRWRLLFTTALDVLSLGLLAPVALVSQVYQNVYETGDGDYDYDLENIVQLEPAVAPVANAFFGRTMAQVTVKAKGKRTSENKVDITFTESQFRPETFAGMEIPARIPKLKVGLGRPVGYIETTFLDKDIRIARAPSIPRQKENLFVLLREFEV